MNRTNFYIGIAVVGLILVIAIILGLTLGFGLRTSTPNVDCVVSSWEPCSKECGGGVQIRKILIQPSGTGTQCPTNLEQACNAQACSVAATAAPAFLFDKTTNADDWGNGNTYFLDRHNIDCGDKSVLNQMVLARPSTNKLQYKYTCLSASDIGTPVQKETKLDVGSNSSIFLDRHDVNCDEGTGLSQLKLVSDGGKFHYKYACAPVPTLGKCVEKQTTANDWGNGSVIYLDRHNIKCDKDQVMSEFKLTRPTPTQLQYNYKCCTRA
jgi:hypothetical protein